MKNKTIPKSIATQIRLNLILLVALIVIGGAFLFGSEQWMRQSYESQLTQFDVKTGLATQIQQNMNGAVTELHGYMALKLPDFKVKLTADRQALDVAIEKFKTLPGLTQEDRDYIGQVEVAEAKFFNEYVPVAYSYTDDNNSDLLVKMIQQQNYIQFTDDFRNSNNSYVNQLNELSAQMRMDHNALLNRLFVGFSVYMIVVAVAVFFLSGRFAKDIGRPLQMLARASHDTESDLLQKLPYAERDDEIGYLTRSLREMLGKIHQNERRLIEANDELQMQQEELISQQDELYNVLMKMQENERILEAQNLLNTSLVNTLDRDELLQSIIKNVRDIQHADKGAIILLEPGYPYASVGIRPESIQAFIQTLETGGLTRVEEEHKIFVVEREAEAHERGYHDEKIMINDLYIPILSHRAEIVALVCLTRLGRSFNAEDLAQAQALANQVSLSVERLHTFEASERDRMLNQEIIDTIREGIQLFDEHGELVQVNQTWCNWLGSEPLHGEGSAERLFTLLEEKVEQPTELITFIQAALAGTVSEQERKIYKLVGDEKKVVQVYFEKISEGRSGEQRTVLVHRDITREYEVDQMKSEFVSTVSHELRTPLSSVLGFTELMLNKDLKPERQNKYLITIHKEAKRLTELINDFLDIQRMESGKQAYEMRDFNLIALAEEVIEGFYMHANKHQFRVDRDLQQAIFRGDEGKIRQVFTNLIGNAIKYSPEGGEVALHFRQGENELLVDVIDQGLGIPKESIGQLFSKFYRIDNSDRRKIGGTGLGLAICKEIMKAHHATITVESELGQGSVFTLHFPINVEHKTDVVPTERPPFLSQTADGQQDKPHLLIIEDDNSLALLLQEELKESGFDVTHVMDGGSAFQDIQRHLPDAIVLDIMLKDSVSGWVVIEELKKQDRTASIPIFISSALDEKERGMALGASDYLTKPYQPSKLSNLILQTLLKKEKNGVIMVPEQEPQWHL